MKLNVLDLFAGCGGLTDGFLQTNKYRTLAAVDWELPAINTLKKRLKTKWNYSSTEETVVHFDIQRITELLNGFFDKKYGISSGLIDIINDRKVDLIIGGPPCQAYSIAGRVRDVHGMQNDHRNYLFESYVKVVSHFQPNAFVFENVEGILSAKPGGTLITKRIKDAFAEIGYEILDNLRGNALFDTSFYNVPQKRKRVIIYGINQNKVPRQQLIDFYRLMHTKRQKVRCAGEALWDLPKIYPIKVKNYSSKRTSHITENNGFLNHTPRFHNERDIESFRILASDIKNGINKYASTKALIQFYKDRTGKNTNIHKYHVIRENKPSNTIPAHLYKDGLRHIHPDPKQARSITVREAARLQSFDDDFEFLGSRGDQYKMIGNAVPPAFAKIIAETISEIWTNSNPVDQDLFNGQKIEHHAVH